MIVRQSVSEMLRGVNREEDSDTNTEDTPGRWRSESFTEGSAVRHSFLLYSIRALIDCFASWPNLPRSALWFYEVVTRLANVHSILS